MSQLATSPTSPQRLNQYVSFLLGEEEYGLPILQVQEILGMPPLTAVPGLPPHLLGVMNLRGAIVPVMDLRRRFELPQVVQGPFSVVIVVEVAGRAMGLLVDAVSNVLVAEDVQPVPAMGARARVEFLSGLANVDGRLVLLLNLDQLFSDEELAATAATA